jgi:Domain of unknown function (DUF5668)
MTHKEARMDNLTTADRRVPMGKLAFGIALLIVGTLAFTDYLDAFEVREIWRYWPVFLIFIGLSSEYDSLRKHTSDGGYILVAIGTWLLVANHHLFNLRHRGAFPIAIAIAGLGVVLHALNDDPSAAKKEKP